MRRGIVQVSGVSIQPLLNRLLNLLDIPLSIYFDLSVSSRELSKGRQMVG